jgi:chlorite dismutase
MEGGAVDHTDRTNLDIRERGANQQYSERRLFMQLHVFGGCRDSGPLIEALRQSQFEGVLYHDVNDPQGIGILAVSEEPAFFVTKLRQLLSRPPFAALPLKPGLTMLGRSYSSGFEPDLEDWLLRRPRRTALNPACPWAIWYPLRRTGAFARLDPKEQGEILKEHGRIGRAYAEANLAHDIRLACHGLDVNDNDFLIGLVGAELHPLSHLVQSMRRTVQTSQYLERLGPFFVGHAAWQSPLP